MLACQKFLSQSKMKVKILKKENGILPYGEKDFDNTHQVSFFFVGLFGSGK
jgi:hypothetical protein